MDFTDKNPIPVEDLLEYLGDKDSEEVTKLRRHLTMVKGYYESIGTCDVVPVLVDTKVVNVAFGIRDYCPTCKEPLVEIPGFSDVYRVCPKCER